MALLAPHFRDLGFFPENSMSKSEPNANQGKESTAAASVAVKSFRSDRDCFDYLALLS